MEGSLTRKRRQIDLNRLLGQQLAKLRRSRHLTQVDIATRMDFQRSLVSKIEHGGHSLDAMEIHDYAAALNMEPFELFQIINTVVCEYDGTHETNTPVG